MGDRGITRLPLPCCYQFDFYTCALVEAVSTITDKYLITAKFVSRPRSSRMAEPAEWMSAQYALQRMENLPLDDVTCGRGVRRFPK